MNTTGKIFSAAAGLLALAATIAAPALADDGASEAPLAAIEIDTDEIGIGIDAPWSEGVGHDARLMAYERFLDGNGKFKDALFAPAAQEYQAALKFWDHPAFRFNLGVTQLNLDQPLDASQHFQRAIKYGPAPIGEEKYREARQYLERLGKRLTKLEVICDEPGAEVTLDGELLFVAPGHHVSMMRPGTHQLTASKLGKLTNSRSLVAEPGGHVEMQLVLVSPGQVIEERRWPEWVHMSVVGVGVGMLAVGGALAAHSSSLLRGTAVNELVRCDVGDQPACKNGPRGRREQRWARAAYAAGGVTLAAGSVLWYFNRSKTIHLNSHGERISLSLSPQIGSNGATVSIFGVY